jgi:ABC-type antimicrobial peptide transport system permease subunit
VQSLLFEISTYNPMVTAIAVGVLALLGVVACIVPARHAAHIDPMQALRRE